MSKIVRVQDGDYKLIVGSTSSPGNIILDTSPRLGDDQTTLQGKVIITGDLEVLGNTTTVNSETLTIKDNIIFINDGETQAGINSGVDNVAGLEIVRGTKSNVRLLWDENVTSYNTENLLQSPDVDGSFVFADTTGKLRAITTNSISTNGGNLNLIGEIGSDPNNPPIVTVEGVTAYERGILDENKFDLLQINELSRTSNIATIKTNLPHSLATGNLVDVKCPQFPEFNVILKSVTVIDSITFSYDNPGLDQPVIINNIGNIDGIGVITRDPIKNPFGIPNIKAIDDYFRNFASNVLSVSRIADNDTSVETIDSEGTSEITFIVDSVLQAKISNSGLTVDNITINNNNIINTNISDNILVDSKLSLAFKNQDPTFTLGYSTLYAKNIPGPGGTGIFFVNQSKTDDELISKTKSILFSLIL